MKNLLLFKTLHKYFFFKYYKCLTTPGPWQGWTESDVNFLYLCLDLTLSFIILLCAYIILHIKESFGVTFNVTLKKILRAKPGAECQFISKIIYLRKITFPVCILVYTGTYLGIYYIHYFVFQFYKTIDPLFAVLPLHYGKKCLIILSFYIITSIYSNNCLSTLQFVVFTFIAWSVCHF